MIWQQQGWVFCVPGTKPSMTSACGQSSDSIGDPDWVHLLSHRSFILFWGSWRLVWVGLVLIHLVQKVLCFFCFKQLYRPSGFTIHIIFRLDESTPKHAWFTDTVYAYLLKSMHVCQEEWLAFSWHSVCWHWDTWYKIVKTSRGDMKKGKCKSMTDLLYVLDSSSRLQNHNIQHRIVIVVLGGYQRSLDHVYTVKWKFK